MSQTYINQWLERSLDDSAVKRIIYPECFMLLEHILVESDILELTTNINILSDEPQRYHLTYHIYSELGDPIFSFSNKNNVPLHQGINNLTCIFPSEFF